MYWIALNNSLLSFIGLNRKIFIYGVRLSLYCFFHKHSYLRLFTGSQLRQRKRSWPHTPFIKIRIFLEAKRSISVFKFTRCLKETNNLTVLIRIRRHPIPGFRRKGRRVGFDNRMEPLADGAIRLRHLYDCFENVSFALSFVLV